MLLGEGDGQGEEVAEEVGEQIVGGGFGESGAQESAQPRKCCGGVAFEWDELAGATGDADDAACLS